MQRIKDQVLSLAKLGEVTSANEFYKLTKETGDNYIASEFLKHQPFAAFLANNEMQDLAKVILAGGEEGKQLLDSLGLPVFFIRSA